MRYAGHPMAPAHTLKARDHLKACEQALCTQNRVDHYYSMTRVRETHVSVPQGPRGHPHALATGHFSQQVSYTLLAYIQSATPTLVLLIPHGCTYIYMYIYIHLTTLNPKHSNIRIHHQVLLQVPTLRVV